jgi:succinate dehydrogenase / fumarate reductase membrane anchor subunit
VVNSNIPDVTLGWANAYWQVMEILMVFFGISHGINGLRVVVEDYMGKTWSRLFWRGFLFFLWLFLLVLAVYVILAS